MNLDNYVQLTVQALLLVLYLSMPPILVATVVGVLVSLMQALTQIQDQTLGTAIKLITVTITLVATAYWMRGALLSFALQIFRNFPYLT
jgi:type III secretion HrpO family protein